MTLDGLTQQVVDLEKDCVDRHRRQGEKAADHKLEMDRIGAEQRATAFELAALKLTVEANRRAPIDIAAVKLSLTPKLLFAIVGSAAAILFGGWRIQESVNSNIDSLRTRQITVESATQDIKSKMETLTARQVASEDVAKARATAEDTQNTAMRAEMAEVKKQMTLLQLQAAKGK